MIHNSKIKLRGTIKKKGVKKLREFHKHKKKIGKKELEKTWNEG